MNFERLQVKLGKTLTPSDWHRASGGGWIYKGAQVENEANIRDDAIIYENAKVSGNAMVSGNAVVSGNVRVFGNAVVHENAAVFGYAWISGNAKVYGNAAVFEDAQVFGYAQVFDDAKVCGKAVVDGNAQVFGNAKVFGNAQVYGNVMVHGNARVFGYAWISGNAEVYGNAKVHGDVEVYEDAKVYGNAEVSGNAQISGDVADSIHRNSQVFVKTTPVENSKSDVTMKSVSDNTTPIDKRESIRVLEECIVLQSKKCNDYQNVVSKVRQADYYPHGVQTLLDIIHAKKLRMESVIAAMTHDSNYQPNFESIEDSAKDMINYCSFIVSYCRGKMDGQRTDHDFLNRPKMTSNTKKQ